MVIKFNSFSVFTISIMAFGFVNAFMSGLTFCCSGSSLFVTSYLVVMAVIAVAELIAAFVFSIKSSKEKVVSAMEDHVVRCLLLLDTSIYKYVLRTMVQRSIEHARASVGYLDIAGRTPTGRD